MRLSCCDYCTPLQLSCEVPIESANPIGSYTGHQNKTNASEDMGAAKISNCAYQLPCKLILMYSDKINKPQNNFFLFSRSIKHEDRQKIGYNVVKPARCVIQNKL